MQARRGAGFMQGSVGNGRAAWESINATPMLWFTPCSFRRVTSSSTLRVECPTENMIGSF